MGQGRTCTAGPVRWYSVHHTDSVAQQSGSGSSTTTHLYLDRNDNFDEYSHRKGEGVHAREGEVAVCIRNLLGL